MEGLKEGCVCVCVCEFPLSCFWRPNRSNFNVRDLLQCADLPHRRSVQAVALCHYEVGWGPLTASGWLVCGGTPPHRRPGQRSSPKAMPTSSAKPANIMRWYLQSAWKLIWSDAKSGSRWVFFCPHTLRQLILLIVVVQLYVL
jgi:hypothetical protein